jgi:hypothetical protein
MDPSDDTLIRLLEGRDWVVLRRFVRQGLSPDHRLESLGGMPILHYAVDGIGFGQPSWDVVRYLVSAGGDVCVGNAKGVAAWTRIFSTHRFGSDRARKEELARLAVEAQGPLAGAKLLIVAATEGQAKDIQFCLDGLGVDINAGDEAGVTPLMAAACRGQVTIVELLLERGADPALRTSDVGIVRDVIVDVGATALDFAKEAKRPKNVHVIQRALRRARGAEGPQAEVVPRTIQLQRDLCRKLCTTFELAEPAEPASGWQETAARFEAAVGAPLPDALWSILALLGGQKLASPGELRGTTTIATLARFTAEPTARWHVWARDTVGVVAYGVDHGVVQLGYRRRRDRTGEMRRITVSLSTYLRQFKRLRGQSGWQAVLFSERGADRARRAAQVRRLERNLLPAAARRGAALHDKAEVDALVARYDLATRIRETLERKRQEVTAGGGSFRHQKRGAPLSTAELLRLEEGYGHRLPDILLALFASVGPFELSWTLPRGAEADLHWVGGRGWRKKALVSEIVDLQDFDWPGAQLLRSSGVLFFDRSAGQDLLFGFNSETEQQIAFVCDGGIEGRTSDLEALLDRFIDSTGATGWTQLG